MTAEANRICPVCGRPLVPDAPHGLCPECLMRSGFELRPAHDVPDGKSGAALPSLEQLAALFPQLESSKWSAAEAWARFSRSASLA